MSDKDFKVKNKLIVNGLNNASGVILATNNNLDSHTLLPTQYGGTGTTTSPTSGQIPYSASGSTYSPTALNTLDVKGSSYSDNAPSSPVVGQIWVESDSTSDSFDPNIIRRKSFTATAAQTVFTTDLEFIQGYEQVFFNGMLLLRNSDYTTASNTNVTLTSGAAVGDIVEIVTITNLNSINAATTTTNTFTGAQTIAGNVVVGGTVPNLSSSTKAITVDSASGSDYAALEIATGGVLRGYLNATNGAMYIASVGSNPLVTYTNGVERMRIDSSGRVGIGISSPTAPLHLSTTSGTDVNAAFIGNFAGAGGTDFKLIRNSTANSQSVRTFRIRGGNDYDGYTSFELGMESNHDLRFMTNNTERMRIGSDGTVTVNSSLSANSLKSNTGVVFYNVSSNIEGNNGITLGTAAKDVAPSGNQGGITIQSNNPSNQALMGGINLVTDATVANRRLTLGVIEQGSGWRNVSINDNGGNLLVGGYTVSQGAYKLQVNSQIFATSASVATSDGRFKENVDTITGGLGIIDSLRPVSFTWKDHPVHNFVSGKTIGFIAQEVQEALSEYDWVDNLIKSNINEETEEEFLGIAESNIIPLLVAAVKELKARVESLEAN